MIRCFINHLRLPNARSLYTSKCVAIKPCLKKSLETLPRSKGGRDFDEGSRSHGGKRARRGHVGEFLRTSHKDAGSLHVCWLTNPRRLRTCSVVVSIAPSEPVPDFALIVVGTQDVTSRIWER